MSRKRWGLDDFSWVFNHCKTLPTNAFKAILNIYKFWNRSECNIQPSPAVNLPDLCALSVWTPNQLQRTPSMFGCRTAPQQRLLQAGLSTFGDLIEQDGSIRQWTFPRSTPSKRASGKAFEGITTNLADISLPHQSSVA